MFFSSSFDAFSLQFDGRVERSVRIKPIVAVRKKYKIKPKLMTFDLFGGKNKE